MRAFLLGLKTIQNAWIIHVFLGIHIHQMEHKKSLVPFFIQWLQNIKALLPYKTSLLFLR